MESVCGNYLMSDRDHLNQRWQDNSQNWEEWKARRGEVVYVNPDIVQDQELLERARKAHMEEQKTTEEPTSYVSSSAEGERDEPLSPLEQQVSLDEESDTSVEDDIKRDKKEDGELEEPEDQEKEEAKESTVISESVEEKKENKRSERKRKRRSPKKKQSRSRSRSRRHKKLRKRSRSSSRDTFDGIVFSSPLSDNIRCNQCNRLFATAHEASVHEIRSHDSRIPCAICTKVLLSPAKLVNHTEKHHSTEKVRCRFCDTKFGGKASELSHAQWNDFREHIFREVLRRKVKEYANRGDETTVLRGIGRCPHGPAIKCRNFPKCPGARCIYSHGRCDFADTCSNANCPFDHPNRPRVCMACVKDLKSRRRTRSPPSRSRD